MTNEEMKAKYEAMNSIEDAYTLMQENGYTGTMEDFEALCARAYNEIGPMDMDAMDAVAGGFGLEDVKDGLSTAYHATADALSKGWNWVQENPGLTTEIVGGAAVAAVGITVGVKYISYRREKALRQEQMRYRMPKYQPDDYASPTSFDDAIRRNNTI